MSDNPSYIGSSPPRRPPSELLSSFSQNNTVGSKFCGFKTSLTPRQSRILLGIIAIVGAVLIGCLATGVSVTITVIATGSTATLSLLGLLIIICRDRAKNKKKAPFLT